MCGIIAIAGKETGKTHGHIASIMTRALSSRGPDDTGTFSFPNCVLGHTRLSIIDLGGGHQPMKDPQTGNAIVFNGEIFNYRELKEELERKGHRFHSSSDTEVILKAYAEFGESCVDRLDGQFAFALWNEKSDSLFLARDRFGEKPLYYASIEDMLIVASEIKAIQASGLVEMSLDMTSLDNYLSLLFIPPWRSAYKSIKPLPPAHRARWKDGKLEIERYWKLKRQPLSVTESEAVEITRHLLSESVKSRLVADVEVGTFLSGGIDSSIITCLSQKAISRTNKRIKAFSAKFDGFIDETVQAKETAAVCGTDHHIRNVEADMLGAFDETIRYFDEPLADSSCIPVHLISQFAREDVKVALSGDGGDELFYGYGHYRFPWNLPRSQKIFQSLFSNPFAYYKNYIQYFKPHEREKLWKDPSFMERDPIDAHIDFSEAKTPLEKINLVDMYMILPGDMLAKVDRASMMNSLEIRSPFLNHKLAEFAYNLPASYKTNRHRGKLILEKAFSDILPLGLFARKKQGFNAPVREWLKRAEWKKRVYEAVSDDSPLAELLDVSYAKTFVDRFYGGEEGVHQKIWIFLVLSAWLKRLSLKK
ncbi:MAG: asparagine synthase (glutamine-hydrolyzing) [Candidatus Taylorbacteria bacterium]|nr:asparagine synthase (glutamine-hydrolyzing) [Candidatus Taylorbacteria bacterium]